MPHYYFGQWEWFPGFRGRQAAWAPPATEREQNYSSIDLRGYNLSKNPNEPSPGYGFFAYPTAQTDPRLLMGFGQDLKGAMTLIQRNIIEQSLQFPVGRLVSRQLADLIEEIITLHSDPAGMDFAGPISGDHRDDFRITLADDVVRRPATLEDKRRARDVFREAYRREHIKLSNGDETLANLQAWTGAKMLRLGVSDPKEVLPPECENEGFRRPGTIKADDFTEGLDTNLEAHSPTGPNNGDGWTLVSGTAGDYVVNAANDEVRSPTVNNISIFRMDNVMGDNSLDVKYDLDSTGGNEQSGPITRLPTGGSPAEDYYINEIQQSAGEMNIQRYDAGTPTFGNGASVTFSFPDNVEMDTNGSGVHDGILNSVSQFTWTNDQHTGNRHGGLRCFHETSGDCQIDNYSCDDGIAAGTTPKGPLGHPLQGALGGPV